VVNHFQANAAVVSDCRLATFYVGELFFGIPVQRVQELLRQQEITPAPLAPDFIEGLINLRGQIVTAVNMREASGPSRERRRSAFDECCAAFARWHRKSGCR